MPNGLLRWRTAGLLVMKHLSWSLLFLAFGWSVSAGPVTPSVSIKAGGAFTEPEEGDRSGELFGRLRLMADAETPSGFLHGAYTLYGRWYESAAANPLLPGSGAAFYRVTAMSDDLADRDRGFAAHEIDRLYLEHVSNDWKIKMGRQGVGLGRGMIFSAYDFFSPFSVVESDREWRRGVDAVRGEWLFHDAGSAEVIVVGGTDWDDGAALGRVRGYVGDVDAELLGGRRGEDELVAGAVSVGVLDAELHLEAAGYRLTDDRSRGMAVAGGSYTFDIGEGLTVAGEYHYNGFGAAGRDELVSLVSDPEAGERLQRGDFRTLGRHEAGVQLSMPSGDQWSFALLTLVNLVDGSGTLNPGISWIPGDHLSANFSLAAGWGSVERPSEYGSVGTSALLQVGYYF